MKQTPEAWGNTDSMTGLRFRSMGRHYGCIREGSRGVSRRHCSLCSHEINNRSGTTISPLGLRPRLTDLQLAHSSRILLLISHWLAKASLAIFTRRLFSGDMNHERPIFAFAFGVTALTGLAAVLINSVKCSAASLVVGGDATGCSGLVR